MGWFPDTMPSLCRREGEAGVLAASAVSESLVSCSGHLKDCIPLLAILLRFLAGIRRAAKMPRAISGEKTVQFIRG